MQIKSATSFSLPRDGPAPSRWCAASVAHHLLVMGEAETGLMYLVTLLAFGGLAGDRDGFATGYSYLRDCWECDETQLARCVMGRSFLVASLIVLLAT
jgi:hypothetical protein